MMRALFIDHYDSFTYNLVHLLWAQDVRSDVVRSDDERLPGAVMDAYDALIVGPGPGHPAQARAVLDAIRMAASRRIAVFGVCFGLQAIGEAFGASVVRAPSPAHGKTSAISHNGDALFASVPSSFIATRYHSLCLDARTLPNRARCMRTQRGRRGSGRYASEPARERRAVPPRVGSEQPRRAHRAQRAPH